MADRRSLFSRFWPPASRRTSTPAALPPATTTRRTPESQSSNQTSPTSSSKPPPRAETKTPARQSTAKASSPPAPATPPRKASPEPNELQKASQVITTSSTDSKDEPKTSSPSRATTRSPSTSKPASPSRLSAQSRSPPQPSSSPQERSTLPSPSRVTPATPKRTSKPPSPSRLTSRSPKQGPSSSPKGKQPASPSKDSMQPTENMSTSYESPILASKVNDPKSAASQREANVKKDVKPADSTNVANGQTQEGKSFKHDDVEAKPSQLSELGNTAQSAQGPETCETSSKMDFPAVNGGDHEPRSKLDAKPAETQDVKEVVQEKKTEVNEETKKKVDDYAAPKLVSEAQIVEKAEIPSEADQMHREKKPDAPDVKDILATHTEVAAPQSTKKSKNSSALEKLALLNGEHAPLHKNVRADVSKPTNQLAKGDNRNSIADRHVSVITLAGENKGASMHMESDSSKRERPVHIHRNYKVNPEESSEAATDGEEASRGKKSEEQSSMNDQLKEAYVNNNAQAINNSIVFNSSITEGSPGVHMVVSHLPKESIQSKDEKHFPETRKAEVNVSRAEKLTYQPTMRRRCLRGLLLETSDSDSENPEKPRRHGCRVSCQKEDTESNVDIP